MLGKKTAAPTEALTTGPKSVVVPTGGQIDEMVMALLTAGNDSDASVRDSILSSLHDIGYRQPSLLASSCVEWLNKSKGASNVHKILVLNTLTRVLEEHKDSLSQELAANTVTMAVEEMTHDKDVVPDLQMGASQAVVSLATIVPNLIMDELMQRFPAGAIPHYFVIKTLGDVAAANSLDTVPRLKEVLGRVVTLLGSLKHDNMKWVFSTALYQFSEAIQSYVANIDKARDKSITMQSFSYEMFSAYEVLLTKWSISNERKLKVATLRAIGAMTSLFTSEQYEQQLSRIVQLLLPLLGKNAKEISLHVTQGLCTVIETGVRDLSVALGQPAIINTIMQTLHPVICTVPDYSNSVALKNYNETLRCFEILGRGHPEAVLTFILSRLEPRDPTTRCGSLMILKHLVVSIDHELEDKKGLLVSGVKPMAQDPTVAVRKSLAQLVIAMASHHYLELEGGETLVEFIVRCCCYDESVAAGAKTPPPDHAGNLELRDICDNILSLATTTIPSMEGVLWPYLFELLVAPQYTPAASVVCRALGFVAARKRQAEAPDYFIDFDRQVNLPKAQPIIAKLAVLLNVPHRRPGMGLNILQCLQSIGPILHPAICDMWDEKMPKLSAYLEEKSKNMANWDSDAWEELVMRLFGETVRVANDDEWSIVLGEALCAQFDHWKSDPTLKKVSMKFLGIILQKNSGKEFIRTKLEMLFQSANHGDDIERNGCAAAFGYCSLTHIDMVLEKLQAILNQGVKKSMGGLFSSGPKLKSDGGDSKNTVMLAYGFVATYANTNLITSRVEIHICNVLRPHITASKLPSHRISICNALSLIAKALHPSHLEQDSFVFKARDEMVKFMIDYLGGREGETDHNVRVASLEAINNLVALKPHVPEELERTLLTTLGKLYCIGTLPATATEKEKAAFAAAQAKAATPDAEDPVVKIMSRLDDILSTLLQSEPSIGQLCRIIEALLEYIKAPQDLQRERSCASLLNLLKKFIQFNTADDAPEKVDKEFSQLGSALAIIAPRVVDPQSRVRRMAVECVGLMLYIDYLLKNFTAPPPPPPATLKALNPIRDRIETGNFDEQLSGMNDLSAVLADMTPENEMVPMLLSAFGGMLDAQPTSQAGVCVMIVGLFKLRGQGLLANVQELVLGLLSTMGKVASDATMNGALHSLKQLAIFHLLPIVKVLLDEPLPHSQPVIKSFQALAKDIDLIGPLVEHLTNIVNNTHLHEEKGDFKNTVYSPMPLPMAATAALGEICLIDEMMSVVRERFAQFFCTLAMRVGTSSLTESRLMPQRPDKDGKPVKDVPVSPKSQIVVAMKSFVWCIMSEAAKQELDGQGVWALLETPAYPKAITAITRTYCSVLPLTMESVFNYITPYLKGNYQEQRAVACIVLAELVNHVQSRPDLLAKLIVCLTESLADPYIKIHAVRGLGNIDVTGVEEANKYATTVIDSLTPPLTDANEDLALVAMEGLAKVFEVIDEEKVAPFLVNLCAQIRPSFAKANDELRAAAFKLFGVLSRYGHSKVCEERFNEQIHAVLPSLLLHCNDDCVTVQQACKASLRRVGPLLNAPDLLPTLQKRFFEMECGTPAYDSIMNEISMHLVNYFPERISHYVMVCVEAYKSQWTRIRANAASLTGFLLSNLPQEKRNLATLNTTIITRALISLLKEKDTQVRLKAAEAMGLLHTY